LLTRLREKEEKIQQVLDCLVQESLKGTPIIVEGKKDVETLRTLDVQGEILCAKTGGKSRLDVVSEIERKQNQEVILLLDFDRRGKEWTAVLKQHLEKTDVKPNLAFWNDLRRLVGKEVKDIEGLAAYIQTLKIKTGET
jgi:2,5-diamino-6-(ribosylamino)-4(3H)-pyrimidinone 5'-phosphate reductase